MLSYVIAILIVLSYVFEALGDGGVSFEAHLVYMFGLAILAVLWDIRAAVKDAAKP